jgi:hypothetical protein
MDRFWSCIAGVTPTIIGIGIGIGTGTAAQAQFMTDLGHQPRGPSGSFDVESAAPALGWISIVDDRASLRSAAEVVIGARQSFFDRVGSTQETAPDAADAIDLGDTRLEAGRFSGVQGNLPVTGLAMDMGVVYHQASNEAAAAGIGEVALDVRGALRYDFGALAVTASLHYAPHAMAAGKSTHYPMLAAEVPLSSVFTLAAGVTRPWTGQNTSFATPDYTQWSVSGSVSMLGFDVMLSYSDSDAAGAAQTPGTEALFKVKRAF